MLNLAPVPLFTRKRKVLLLTRPAVPVARAIRLDKLPGKFAWTKINLDKARLKSLFSTRFVGERGNDKLRLASLKQPKFSVESGLESRLASALARNLPVGPSSSVSASQQVHKFEAFHLVRRRVLATNFLVKIYR